MSKNTATVMWSAGRGLRILVLCPDYKDNRRTGQIEVYAHGRFLTLTSHHWGDAVHDPHGVRHGDNHTFPPAADGTDTA